MNIISEFLQAEINTQELYEEIMHFITSFHIRCGELEGNGYIIKKMDQTNFIIFSEYELANGEREIHAAVAAYRLPLIKMINEYAVTQNIRIKV